MRHKHGSISSWSHLPSVKTILPIIANRFSLFEGDEYILFEFQSREEGGRVNMVAQSSHVSFTSLNLASRTF